MKASLLAITMEASPRPAGLIQRNRELLRARHYTRRTVKTHEQWLRHFLRFHNLRRPREMGSTEVNAFLSQLAVDLQASASTQNQALAALLFLYRELLEVDLDQEGVGRAHTQGRLPELQDHLLKVHQLHRGDLAAGWGQVVMP